MVKLAGVQRVNKYQTDDGKLFDSVDEAKVHSAQLEIAKELAALLESTFRTGRMEAVVLHVLEEAAAIQALLGRYRRMLPFSARGIVKKQKRKGGKPAKAEKEAAA